MTSDLALTWKKCAEQQDGASLDHLLQFTPGSIGRHVLATASPWLLQEVTKRGRGPTTWAGADWAALAAHGNNMDCCQDAASMLREVLALMKQEAVMWKLTKHVAVQRFTETDWAECLKGALAHANRGMFSIWLQRAKDAHIDVGRLVVPRYGTLMRMAWNAGRRAAVDDLLNAGVSLTSPEPLVDPSWSKPGWSLALQLAEEGDFPSPHMALWKSLLAPAAAQLRAEAIDAALTPAPPVGNRPRF